MTAAAAIASRRKDSARERILDCAEAAILQKGFASTSIDELLAATGLSKSGFFYHFKDKSDLASALIERYIVRDRAILGDLFARADALHDDPLHSFLIAMKLLAEMMDNVKSAHPGCLVSSFVYQEQLFSREVRETGREVLLMWRNRFRERLDAIISRYPPRVDVDIDALADMALTLIDGGITMSKGLNEPGVLARQVLLYRAFVRSIFEPA